MPHSRPPRPQLPTPRVEPYTGPAGGWDALRRSWQALRDEHITALGSKTLLRANQPTGFDCPGCAWPDKNPHSTFEFCENGVKAVAAEATAKRIDRRFFAEHAVSSLLERDDLWLEAQGRLTEPMVYEPASDRYQPIDWEDAFALIAAELRRLDSPNQALFYTSGRTSNEAAFLYQLMVREFGTNNLPDCSNMCHEPSGVAMTEQIGSGKGSVVLDDFAHAEAIFVFGQNPGTNHPRMLGELRAAAKRGCRVVVFNPLRERGLERFADPQSAVEMLSGGSTPIASHYFQPRIGGDLAVALGMAKWLVEQGALDREFIAAHTEGFEALSDSLAALNWQAIEQQAGLPRSDIETAARILAGSQASILCWGMGITQHRRSVATIQSLINLLLLRGQFGKPGAGACPVRGHSNVQGDRTMGIYEKPSAAFLDALNAEFGFAPPREHGFDVVGAIDALLQGKAQILFAMGGNFAAATPDSQRCHAALRRCRLTVQVSTKLNRSHLVHGEQALILPCLGRTEIDLQAQGPQAVTVEDSMSMVHLSAGMNRPASEQLKSEPAIVVGLAQALLPNSRVPWSELLADYDRIRDRISKVVPGFENFNLRVHRPGGFHLDHPCRQRRFPTASGKAKLYVHDLLDVQGVQGGGERLGRFTLMTVRSHDQYNTTVYGLDDRYRGVNGERRVCFIHPDDRQALGFGAGQRIDIASHWHDGERWVRDFLLVDYDLPRGCLASYFPETNPLVPLDSVAERAGTPASKSIPVSLHARSA
ncbi:FdhF/YdeP family oxidoreductase [Pseudomarimonas arenosa]|uniref:FdhF/YdeP family oxidoreductase n=1 Tax=Pseudomarimonas arenosa TaxID=2774145 RepID=A0AAW3ZIU5_9GAMM|nr:FdhF/YdeP family oxidoreductase [Pseudomarimonas arenosa]MBD8525990.1 FdhF/YdeP family oxidoreductase [Pseudomarimonas arenosa]